MTVAKGKIYLASDHGGFYLKNKLIKYLEGKGFLVIDLGNNKYQAGDDYPDFVFPLAKKVSYSRNDRGIVICRSGVGSCIVANKVKGIRAVNADNKKIAQKSREHNATNVLCLGSDYLSFDSARKIVDIWLQTKFSAGRHLRRIKKISKLEKGL